MSHYLPLLYIAAIFARLINSSYRLVHVEFVDEHRERKDGPYVNDTVCSAQGVLLNTIRRPIGANEHSAIELTCDDVECGLQNLETSSFVAVIQYPKIDVFRQQTIVEQVRQAIFWGASAVVMLAINAEAAHKWEMDDSITKPVVLISRNISQITKALANSSRVFVGLTSSINGHRFSRLTLWTQCGRLSGLVWNDGHRTDGMTIFWEGTVCPHDGRLGKDMPHEWIAIGVAVSVLMLILILKNGAQRSDALTGWMIGDSSIYQREVVQYERRRAAKEALCKLPLIQLNLLTFVELAVDGERRDCCVICLDEYSLQQQLRLLPCDHRFHPSCVDPWLIDRQTCPLCKRIAIQL